jgi:pimeloyl-ACP methyl ester carboxylesterase
MPDPQRVPSNRRWLQASSACLLVFSLARCSGPTDAPTAPPSPAAPDSPELPAPSPAVLGMTCVNGQLSSGAPYTICVNRALWNGDLVVFVPGYTNPAAKPSTPSGDIGGVSAPDVITSLGYAWAATGFRETGLVVPATWIGGDLLALVTKAKTYLKSSPGHVYMTGGSQGGLITALAVERYPGVFTGGGLAACGPIGSYRRQLRYVADFRAVFDYYFDPVIPGWPVWIQSAPNNGAIEPSFWNATHRAQVASALQSYPARTANVLGVTKAPIDPGNPGPTTRLTFDDLLRYTFVVTKDAMAKQGGLAYDNTTAVYSGSTNNAALNAGIQRFTFTASPTLVAQLETTGRLTRPLVTIHTTGDHIVPEWHESLYRSKTSQRLSSLLLHSRITVSRYGHCTFTADEVLGAFALLVLKATGQNLVLSQEALAEPRARADFVKAAREYGASPVVIGDPSPR